MKDVWQLGFLYKQKHRALTWHVISIKGFHNVNNLEDSPSERSLKAHIFTEKVFKTCT